MVIPEEFKYFTRCFYNGIFEENYDERKAIQVTLGMQKPQQLIAIKSFLDAALAKSSGPELQQIWNSGGAIYGIPDDNELRAFLTLIHDMIQ